MLALALAVVGSGFGNGREAEVVTVELLAVRWPANRVSGDAVRRWRGIGLAWAAIKGDAGAGLLCVGCGWFELVLLDMASFQGEVETSLGDLSHALLGVRLVANAS